MRALAPLALTLLITACGDGESLLPPDARLPDGGRYRGDVVNGLLQGKGRIDYPNGSWYSGEFRGGQWNGQGQWHASNGDVYQGGFQDGLFHGQGTLTTSGGSYVGGYKLGRRDGEGTLKEHGMTYRGEFKADQYDGAGHLENADGDVWSGQFKDGAFTGKGELIGADGSNYQGQFRNWRFSGEGRLKMPDGSLYVGHFENDNYEGQGVLTAADGGVQSGTWANGQRVRDAQGKLLPDPLETGLLAQGPLLEKALAAVPASTPAIELYSLVVGGDGKQSVFLREADYVSKLLATRFGAFGQITLVNHRDHMADRPLATRENISRAVQTLAQRSGPEDLIFIYLTSHGTHDHELVLDQPRLELSDLPANEMAGILAPLKNRDKIVVISACYSGGFIPAIKDERTMVITASREDRVSFGCSEEADFTYFGEALFGKALVETDDLQQAFNEASKIVAQREIDENFEASEPQIWAPKGVIAHWQKLRKSQAERALNTVSVGDAGYRPLAK